MVTHEGLSIKLEKLEGVVRYQRVTKKKEIGADIVVGTKEETKLHQ